MSNEYGRVPPMAGPQAGTDPPRGQATGDAPSVPQARTEHAPGRLDDGTGPYTDISDISMSRRAGRGEGRSATAMGFTILAASLMVLGGVLSFFTGLEAVLRGHFFVVTSNYVYNIDINSWGWIHIGIGAVVFVAGLALFARQAWARYVGVFLAVVSAVLNFLFIPHYPLWSIVVIALDVVIIWALTAGWRREAY